MTLSIVVQAATPAIVWSRQGWRR